MIRSLIVLLFCLPACADTFTVNQIWSDNGIFFYGMDDAGDVVLHYIDGPYVSYIGGQLSFVPTPPDLTYTSTGSPCPDRPSGFPFLSACNGSHEVYTDIPDYPYLHPAYLYASTDNGFEKIADSHLGVFLYMNPEGIIVWNDPLLEWWNEAVDTPEINTVWMLLTGSLLFLLPAARNLSRQ